MSLYQLPREISLQRYQCRCSLLLRDRLCTSHPLSRLSPSLPLHENPYPFTEKRQDSSYKADQRNLVPRLCYAYPRRRGYGPRSYFSKITCIVADEGVCMYMALEEASGSSFSFLSMIKLGNFSSIAALMPDLLQGSPAGQWRLKISPLPTAVPRAVLKVASHP